jgi:hypothetical protein
MSFEELPASVEKPFDYWLNGFLKPESGHNP